MTAFEPLPKRLRRVFVPPIKCQGIKTKLVPFILANVQWDGRGRWIEPFLGSGVVLLNVRPQRAVANDSNPHIIELYRRVQDGRITPRAVGEHLTREGELLASRGESYYYAVRDRFNRNADPLDFLLLNRSCFNGVMRFNRKGEFNVPFCRKTERFQQAYVTKVVNQVSGLGDILSGRTWDFRAGDWRSCLQDADEADFVYFDPPYIGRHTDYYSQWSDDDAVALAEAARSLPCGFALSMWKQNRYRANAHLREHWGGMVERTVPHFYHVGSTESLRNAMVEALVIKPGHEATAPAVPAAERQAQGSLVFAG
ncbi:MAG: Dam family site-specific DNA-(adenine-N6)-methyltransferase [Planctomycetes bacterium]|nr:Dam family site-specific DNA-(adenine-N6)-methyltransferase [Planctomycetota bacterium]